MRQPILLRNLAVFNRYIGQIAIKNSRRMLSTSPRNLDHYNTLGITNKASPTEIKESYLKKCKEFHPDKHQGNQSMHDKFVKINDAYTILSDPKKKSEYDMKFNTSTNQKRSQHAWGNRHTSSGPEDVWQQSYKHADQRTYRSQDNPYRSHNNPYKSHDNPYEHWRNSQTYQQRAANYRNRNHTYRNPHKDPLNDYWDSVYNANKNSQTYNNHASNEPDLNSQRDYIKTISYFLGILIIVLWVRYWIAMRNLQKNHEWYQKPYYERENNADEPSATKEKSGNNKGTIDDLNLKTEDA